MAARAVLIMATLTVLAGCSTNLNPFNWFGQQEETTSPSGSSQQIDFDPRPLVAEVTSVSLEQNPGGAILRAVGLPPTQGHWNAELVEVDGNNPSVLTYRFRLAPPRQATRVSTRTSREVVVATFISNQTLEETREIQVLGARSSRALRP